MSAAARYSRELSKMGPKERALSKAILGWRLSTEMDANAKPKIIKVAPWKIIAKSLELRKAMSAGKEH